MGSKKELKKLLERIEAIETEIKTFKETAEKNVATISAEIEKLVAASNHPVKSTRKAAGKKTTAPAKKAEPEIKAEKPARKPRVAKKKQVEEKPAPEAEKKEPELKATRTRKPKAAAPRRGRASFVLYNCDEAKTPESKYNRNDETFIDSVRGRNGLWRKLKTEITEGRIEILDNYPIRNVGLEIKSGNPESVSKYLKYGLIEKVE